MPGTGPPGALHKWSLTPFSALLTGSPPGSEVDLDRQEARTTADGDGTDGMGVKFGKVFPDYPIRDPLCGHSRSRIGVCRRS